MRPAKKKMVASLMPPLRSYGLILTLALAATPAGAGELSPKMARMRCIVADRLSQLQSNKASKDRYLVVARSDTDAYLQCLFLPNRTQLLCEAVSGFYQPGRPDMAGDKGRALLAKNGFDTNFRNGNYQKMIALDANTSLNDVADLLMMLLRDVYGAQDTTPMKTVSSLIKRDDGAEARCSLTG